MVARLNSDGIAPSAPKVAVFGLRMKKIACLAFFALGAATLFSQQAVTDAEVVRASDALLKSPKDTKPWQILQDVIRAEGYSSDVRSRVMYLFAVNHLLRMNTNLYATALQTLQAGYPKDGAILAERLTPADWLVPCPDCGGTGVKKSADAASSARCLSCLGSGKIFQLSPRVKEQAGAVLNEIRALATENIQFAEASKKAFAENSPQRRLAALQELVGKYAHRKDLEGAKQELAKIEADMARADAMAQQKKAEQELRDQEERAYRNIAASLETLPDSGIPVMVKEIERFIEKFPKSSYRLELEISKSKLQQRAQIHKYVWIGFYLCTGFAAFAVLASFIKGLFTMRKKRTGPLPVPGLNQESEASDPLAGTFNDNDQP